MRLVTVRCPKGKGVQVADVAMTAGIAEVAVLEGLLLRKSGVQTPVDEVKIETSTPKAKAFLESLMDSPIYDANSFSFSVRHPESIFTSEPPEEETIPIPRPTTDVYEELWQFCKVTRSLILRVFLSAFLVAYGIREGFMPLVIAGLLFLPYHHHMLGLSFAAGIKEWRLFRQALSGFLISTVLIFLGGVAMALLSHPGIKWTAFTETTFFFSLLISMAIGIAAGLGSTDDAGRKELIGLAATAHISVYPIWFGLKAIYGFDPSDKPLQILWVYLMDVATLIFFAGLTFKFMRMKGRGIKNFLKVKKA